MKQAAVLLLLLVYLSPVFGQSPKEVGLDEADRLTVQLQIALQENAELRKRLAQAELRLAEANAELVRAGSDQVLRSLAEKHGVKAEEYELRLTEEGDIRLVRKQKVDR